MILISSKLLGQNIDNDRDVIKLVSKINHDNKIYYIDITVGWQRIDENLKKRKFVYVNPQNKNKETIRLSKKEYRFLLKQIDLNKEYIWNNNLIDNSVILNQDSMFTLLNVKQKERIEQSNNAIINKDTITYNKLKNKYFWVNGYSKPIYLRENSICLLYHFERCGRDCGYDEIWILKKENGNWNKWFKICEGAY